MRYCLKKLKQVWLDYVPYLKTNLNMSRQAHAGQNKSMAAIFCGSFQAVNLHKGIQTYEANQRTNEHTHTLAHHNYTLHSI